MWARLFASGEIVDWIVVLMAVECVAVLIAQRLLGRPQGSLALLVALGAGLALLLALRAALVGQRWQIVAAWLATAFVAHLCDLRFRLRRARA